jgi:hypothetical protein
MTVFLRVLAHISIWTTPFQIVFCLWALGVVLSSDATVLSLSNDIFFSDHLPFLYLLIKPFTYIVLPDALANFIWSLPTVIHQLFKAVVSTWLGLWILKKLNQGHPNPAFTNEP